MRSLILSGLIIASLAACKRSAPGQAENKCSPPPSASLGVSVVPQELSNWCWAASGQMVMHDLGTDVSQCVQATDEFGVPQCCPSAFAPDKCDAGGWPEFEKHNIKYQRTSSRAISWNEIQTQIGCRKQPFAFSWKWSGGGGHMMVAVGYMQSPDGTQLVEVNDPWKPNEGSHYFITYDEFVAAANNHDHWDDFFDFKKGM